MGGPLQIQSDTIVSGPTPDTIDTNLPCRVPVLPGPIASRNKWLCDESFFDFRFLKSIRRQYPNPDTGGCKVSVSAYRDFQVSTKYPSIHASAGFIKDPR